MKLTKGKIILGIIIIYFTIMGIKSINKEKSDNEMLLDNVTIVTDGKIKESNEGNLVLLVGEISYDDGIALLELENKIDTFKLKRTVQDYKEEKNENGKVVHEWKNREEGYDSDNYLYTIASEEFTIDTKIGDFHLDKKGMELVEASSLYKDQEKIGDLEFDGLFYSLLDHEDNEQVGDMRISYYYFDTTKTKYLSVLAEQKGDTFVPYKLDKKTEVYRVYNGKIDTKDKLKDKLNAKVKADIRGKIIFIVMILGVGIFLIVDNKRKKATNN